ncbi:valine--tRNA ligase [Coemansia javaensis]|uniref:Valine--tRNA ligase n=1 Tax=Coemansia javaensis TaxID=2761396 RepID=A0A9W8LJ13_9FUNG|nr:valine--tRNA ligase [Coemansia javaensis]
MGQQKRSTRRCRPALPSPPTPVHGFWLYELRDVLIKYAKPIATPDADPAVCGPVLQALYTCFDQGLPFSEPRADYEGARTKSDFELVNGIAAAQGDGIATMVAGCGRIAALRSGEAVPAGCAAPPVNDQATVRLLVRGRVDFEQEIGKAEKKIAGSPGYEKAPPAVRESSAAKVAGYSAEMEVVLRSSIEALLVPRDGGE